MLKNVDGQVPVEVAVREVEPFLAVSNDRVYCWIRLEIRSAMFGRSSTA